MYDGTSVHTYLVVGLNQFELKYIFTSFEICFTAFRYCNIFSTFRSIVKTKFPGTRKYIHPNVWVRSELCMQTEAEYNSLL